MRQLFAALICLVAPACASVAPAPVAAERAIVSTTDGIGLYVERYGQGRNVVIAPGRLFMGDHFSALAAPDRTLILYDMRNRGASAPVEDPAALTILEDVNDLEAIRAHFGVERFSVVGYSYLGLMVALYAAEHPERIDRVVQIGPVPRQFGATYSPEERAGEDTLSAEGREAWASWRRASEGAGGAGNQFELCQLQSAAMAYWLVGNPANASAVADTCIYENEWPAHLERHFDALWGDIVRERNFPASMFTALSHPVLIVHGTRDRNAAYGSGREWARTWPNARLITLPGVAHNVWLEDADVIQDIDRFLSGAWPSRAERAPASPR